MIYFIDSIKGTNEMMVHCIPIVSIFTSLVAVKELSFHLHKAFLWGMAGTKI